MNIRVAAVAASALLVAGALGPVVASAQPGAKAKARAVACLERAAAAESESRFGDAAEGYQCAAEESARGRDAVRAGHHRGLAHLARAWDLHARVASGTAGRANLEEAIRNADQAVTLLRRPGGQAGLERLAEGWRSQLVGGKAALLGLHAESRRQFEAARAAAAEVSTAAPALGPRAERLLRLAQDQLDGALIAELLESPQTFVDRDGEIVQRLTELRERATGDARRWYDGLRHFYEGQRRFEEASVRLEGWRYREAAGLLDEAAGAFAKSVTAIADIPRAARREQFGALVDGLARATVAEKRHAAALEALLGGGNPTRARAELVDGGRVYREALSSLDKVGHSTGSIAAVRAAARRLGERAAAMEQAVSVPRVLLSVGTLFAAISLGALGLLVVLGARLGLDRRLLVALALLAGVAGTLGLEAPRVLEAMGRIVGKSTVSGR